MSQPYLGEMRIFAGNFVPEGWMACEGQLLAIAENDILFDLIGTTYGGDGQSTFALPDLRGRLPIHFGNGFTQAQNGGIESVTLTVEQLPVHSHPMVASTHDASAASAGGKVLAHTPTYTPYLAGNPADTALAAGSISADGGNQSHNNLQPYVCLTFIISISGTFPSQ